jgi:hypothetical protein
MGAFMANTYTIEGLEVPELAEEIAAVREELSVLRTLFNAAVEAITRLDDDVATLAARIENG